MRYLSSIGHGDVGKHLIQGDNWLKEYKHDGSFFQYLSTYGVVHDTETNVQSCLSECSVGVVGIGCDGFSSHHIAVTHTQKSALLHKYIRVSSTKMGFPPRNPEPADVMVYPHNFVANIRDENVVPKKLDILMSVQTLSLNDSVVVWEDVLIDNSGPIICTLYDFLIFLCRHMDLNIMKYKTVQFESRNQRWFSQIDFADTKEAERFFSKMWLDVKGHYSTVIEKAG